jgi:Zn-dependent peptidase ImmA (M78 family)/transcriptional regulator with XRE-family HTH domain
MIFGDRVRQMREVQHLTQAELVAEIPGLTQSQLSRIETDLAEPGAGILDILAAMLGVSAGFFAREPAPDLAAHSPQLRARSRLTQSTKTSALQWARLVVEEYQRLADGTNRPPLGLKRMCGATPIEAAAEVREALGFLPQEPLPYLLLAVERFGIMLVGLPISADPLDAFCAWRGNAPLIALLADAPGDRQRFSVAHELGHLVLHPPGRSGSAGMEAEADEFAAELLTPSTALTTAMPRHPTLRSLAMLKTHWGVSVKSLVRRARELEIIDYDKSISLYKQISARGWNRVEPGYVPLEKPRAFRKLVELSYGAGPNVQRFASDAGWSEELALAVLARHASAEELPFEVDHLASPNVIHLSRRLRSVRNE